MADTSSGFSDIFKEPLNIPHWEVLLSNAYLRHLSNVKMNVDQQGDST
jgi:hypothetical protein